MKPLVRRLKRVTDHPLTKLVLGLILMVSSIAEGYGTFFDDMRHFRLRAHHGLLVFAFANVLAAIPGLVEGLEKEIEILEGKAAGARREAAEAHEQALAERH